MQLEPFRREVKAACARDPSLKFPDVIFLFNLDDEAVCLPGVCSAPMMTLMKKWNSTHGGVTEEILLPHLNHATVGVVHYPFEKKKPAALLRAGLYHRMDETCPRMKLYRLSRTPQVSVH